MNSQQIALEEQADGQPQVTLETVFQLAKQDEDEGSGSSSSESDNDEMMREQQAISTEKIIVADVRPTIDRQD